MTDLSKSTNQELIFELFTRGVSCVINVGFEYKAKKLNIKSTTENPISAVGCDFTKTQVIFGDKK
jgi:hypothetical protein